MTWKVEYSASGAAHTVGLPEAAYKALTEALVVCLPDPWALTRPDNADAPEWRWLPFDENRGGVSLYLDDSSRTIRVYEVVWTG